MKRVLCASVLAMGCTIALSAQSGTADKPKDDKMAADAKTVAVTGCVQRAQQMNTTGTTGTTTPSASPIKFVLTSAAVSTTGTAGTSGTTAAPASDIAREYRLDTEESTMTPHVGHKVEVTGTMKAASMDKDAMKKDTMAKPDAMAGHDMKKDAAMAGTLTVKDLKMISASCS